MATDKCSSNKRKNVGDVCDDDGDDDRNDDGSFVFGRNQEHGSIQESRNGQEQVFLANGEVTQKEHSLQYTGSCLNMRMCHPHVEDDTAQNHYELLWLLEMMLRNPMNYKGCWK
jgi:hypothetical protein